MRSTPFRSLLAGSLVLALGLPGGALAAPGSKSKSAKSAKGDAAAKDPGKGTEKDPGDPSVPPPAYDGPPRIGRVFVDASGLGDAGPVIGGRATLIGKGALQDQGVTYTDVPAGPELQVTLRERDAGGYRVDYVIVYDGKPTKNGSGGFDCQLCTEDELVEKVEALVIQVAPKMVVPEEEPEGEEPDRTDPDSTRPDDTIGPKTDPLTDEDPSRLGPKGKAGIGLLVVGGVGVLTGVVLVALPDWEGKNGTRDASKLFNAKNPGYGVLGGGAAFLIVGAVLLGLDRAQAKRRAGTKKEARLHPHPWFGPQGAGLGVTGRF